MDRFLTALLVAVVTLLIWIFAEGESLSAETFAMEVRIESDVPGLVASAAPTEGRWTGFVEARMAGSIARLNRMHALLRREDAIVLGIEEIGREGGRIRLAEALRRHPLFVDSGVTIHEVDPATVEVIVDELIERTLEVQVETLGAQLQGAAVPSPKQVRLRLPQSLSIDLPDSLAAVAEVPAEMLQALVPGRRTTLPNVRVRLPAGLRELPQTTLDPAAVDVTLTLAARTGETSVANVPVDIRMPGLFADDYTIRVVEGSGFLRDVRLMGPSELVERIGPGRSFQPRAEVFLVPSELDEALVGRDRAELVREPRLIGLPSGVDVVGEVPAVRILVSRRDGEEGQAPER